MGHREPLLLLGLLVRYLEGQNADAAHFDTFSSLY